MMCQIMYETCYIRENYANVSNNEMRVVGIVIVLENFSIKCALTHLAQELA